MNRWLMALLLGLIIVWCESALAQGTKKNRVRPHLYGQVVISNYSAGGGLAPVAFDHWSHRARATCRLCHVDLGFAMFANGSDIRATDNMRGFFCGACHNEKPMVGGRKAFAACAAQVSGADLKRCEKCHAPRENPAKEQAFLQFTATLPRERFGNGIDWERAETEGLIKPVDHLQGMSAPREKIMKVGDIAVAAQIEGVPDIIFSHQKHTVWNGCEVCHPDLFFGVRKGASKYSMIDLFEGKYCGVCHDTVAFPQIDCQRCHLQPVR